MSPYIIEVLLGDISRQKDVTAVVNAANAWLRPGGGVAGALHRAAGPDLYRECRPLAPIRPGEAVITGGHNLPNRYVIHCLGPVHGSDHLEAELLSDCYRNALLLADEHGIDSIAFPAISAGAFGYPVEEVARIAIETVLVMEKDMKNLKKVRFVLHSERDLNTFKDALSGVEGK
ncbi:MAG: macro domain-containing protein [Candidatus Thermoplasmatota archaeon]|nr:macro domain-containing protein [Candidatus Thermoplasmatota archaeon]